MTLEKALGNRDAAYEAVLAAGEEGAAWYQVANALKVHHGIASGALSYLHKEGRVARLEEKRGGCSIYVAPWHVGTRTVVPYRKIRRNELAALEERARLIQILEDGHYRAAANYLRSAL